MFNSAKEIFDDLTSRFDVDQIQTWFVPYLFQCVIERENNIKEKHNLIQKELIDAAELRAHVVKMFGANKQHNTITEMPAEEGDVVFEISPATVEALKQFDKISKIHLSKTEKTPGGILISPGRRLRVKDRRNNILGEYLSDDEFPVELGISHIDRFVAMLDSGRKTKVVVRDNIVMIGGNRFPLVDDKEFLCYPQKELARPSVAPTSTFLLTAEKINKIGRDARTVDTSDVCFLNDLDNNIVSIICDTRCIIEGFRISDVICASPTKNDFCVWLSVDLLRVLPPVDFRVSVYTESVIVMFDGVDSRYTYCIPKYLPNRVPERVIVLRGGEQATDYTEEEDYEDGEEVEEEEAD